MLKIDNCVYLFANLLPKKSFVVGGFVRDFLLDKQSNDVDICSYYTPEQLKKYLQESDFKIISVSDYLTAKIQYKKNNKIFNFEYTCFRKDFYNYKNSHIPYKIKQVSTLKQDSNRRDFTINCIYFDIKKQRFIDPKHGLKHIKNGVIKTVLHPKKTLKFDGERLLRLIKLKAITNFEIDKKTLKYAIEFKQNINKLTNKLKQKYFDFFKALPPKNYQNILPVLNLLDIKI